MAWSDMAAAAAAPGSESARYVLLTQCLQNDLFLNRECRLVLPDLAVRTMLMSKKSYDKELGTDSRRKYRTEGPCRPDRSGCSSRRRSDDAVAGWTGTACST